MDGGMEGEMEGEMDGASSGQKQNNSLVLWLACQLTLTIDEKFLGEEPQN